VSDVSAAATPIAEIDRARAQPVLELDPGPESRRAWLGAMWDHRGVIWVLARKDFQARYKRATLGVLWAVMVPLLQGAVMALIFSHFVHARGVSYGAFVLSGVLPWSYFSTNLPTGATAIVDGTALTDKVWFPRAILPLVPCLSGVVGLGISMIVLIVLAPLLNAHVGVDLLVLVPACALLIAFTVALTSVLGALQVYFRDVRFIVTAALMVWLYATPILYPQYAVGALARWLDFNPMTGIVTLFHIAVLGGAGPWVRSVAISVAATLVLLVIAIEAHRRHDRLFVDLL
jgi:lipopolysaccharide transport system permease protein